MPDTIENSAFPSANLDALYARQTLNQQIRTYFAAQGVLEVETPIISQAPNCDRGSQAFQLGQRFLHSSPEHAMKRLLCMGSGSIYQLCKVFRADEAGAKHNPEFSMLEWYRTGWNYQQLMQEVADLANVLLQTQYPIMHIPYQEAYKQYAGFDPFTSDTSTIQTHANTLAQQDLNLNRDESLDLIMSLRIEPQLPHNQLVFILDFPASQAAMAQLKQVTQEHSIQVAQRFELFINGMEIANGYQELTCTTEQKKRFDSEEKPVDQRLLHCMQTHPLPTCSGVAMGVDRLLMLKLNKQHIQDVLSFAWAQA